MSAYPNLSDLSTAYPGLHRLQQQPPIETPKMASMTMPVVASANPTPTPVPASQRSVYELMPKPARVEPSKLELSAGETLETAVCGNCNKQIGSLEKTSIVVFGVCKHAAHLRCIATTSAGQAEKVSAAGAEYFVGGAGVTDSLCMQCVKDSLSRRMAARGTPDMNLEYRDPEEILHKYKLIFRRDNPKTYEATKNEPVSLPDMLRLLRAPTPGQPFAITKALRSVTQRMAAAASGGGGGGDEEAPESPDALAERIKDTLVRNEYGRGFLDCMYTLDRTLDDFLSVQGADLLTLYRCGVRSLLDLNSIGFNAHRHLAKAHGRAAKSPAIPMWQLYDLYGVRFQTLINRAEPDWGLQIDNLCNELGIVRIVEWALLGATVKLFIALGMQYEHVVRFGFDLSQWQRYFLMEQADLAILGIKTRSRFVDELGWPHDHPWCPANSSSLPSQTGSRNNTTATRK
jgi:hypothetical protein